MQSGPGLGCAALNGASAPPAALSAPHGAFAWRDARAAPAGDLAALDAALSALDHSWRHVHLQHCVLAGALATERNFIEALRACRHRCPVERETSPQARAELLNALSGAITAMHQHEHRYRELRARLLAAGEFVS